MLDCESATWKIFSCTCENEVNRRRANVSFWETKTLDFTLIRLWFPDTDMMNSQKISIEYKSREEWSLIAQI